MVDNNLTKFGAKNSLKNMLKTEIKGIFKDNDRTASFLKGVLIGTLPESPNNFKNKDEVYGYLVGKIGMEILPDEYKAKVIETVQKK